MKFTDEAIADFIQSWRHAFNEDISPGEARIRMTELTELLRSLSEGSP